MNKTLYHGTSIEFDGNKIDLTISSRPKDFGNGFYLTSIYEQAKVWSKKNRNITKNKDYIIKIYRYDEVKANEILSILTLDKYNREWLEYVIKNRNSMHGINDNYDLVIGLMADGQVARLIKDYTSDYITEEELLEELQFQYKTDQYTFKSDKSLELLNFEEDKYNVDGSESYGK